MSEDRPEVRVRATFWDLVAAGLTIVVNLVILLEKAQKHRRLLRRLVFWFLNPRVLAIAVDIPSFIGFVATANQMITNQASWGSVPMEIMLLSISGIGISAPLIFTPYRRRGDSYINFKPS